MLLIIKIILLAIILFISTNIFAQQKLNSLEVKSPNSIKTVSIEPYNILNNWVTAHNANDKEIYRKFINDFYSPTLLETINIDLHIEFYQHFFEMHGKLLMEPYKTEIANNQKLKVHLLKKGMTTAHQLLPENIIVVEINMDEDNSDKVKSGLGLGALVCEIYKK